LTEHAGCGKVHGCHIDIRGPYGKKQSYQAPRGGMASEWKQKADRASNLCHSTEVDQHKRRGEQRGNDPFVDAGDDEMKDTGEKKEGGEEDAANHLTFPSSVFAMETLKRVARRPDRPFHGSYLA